jgi:hypothetical protein
LILKLKTASSIRPTSSTIWLNSQAQFLSLLIRDSSLCNTPPNCHGTARAEIPIRSSIAALVRIVE